MSAGFDDCPGCRRLSEEADGLSRSLNAAVAELDEIRDAIIEECARVAENKFFDEDPNFIKAIAAAIRALKATPDDET